MIAENLSPNNPGYYTGSPSEGEEDSNNEENPYGESVNSEEYDQQQGTFKPFVNNNMNGDREDDDIMEEDGNLYQENNCQPFSMNQGGNPTTFGTGGNAPNSSSTGSSSNLSNQTFPKVADGKKRRRFTPEEDKKIKEGIAKNKKDNNIDWDGVAKFAGIQRTKEQIKSRYMRMRKDDGAADAPPPQQCSSSSSNVVVGTTTTPNNLNTDANNRSNIPPKLNPSHPNNNHLFMVCNLCQSKCSNT